MYEKLKTMIGEAEKRRLHYQCRRGMLELDVILLPYFEANRDQLDEAGMKRFAVLLEEADPDLYTWLMGYGAPEDPELLAAVAAIREYTLSLK